jgi:hypothetical protein
MNKLISLLMFLIIPLYSFADIRDASGEPIEDFYTVWGAIHSVEITKEICNASFPEYRNQNSSAYSLWRDVNGEFIHDFEEYNRLIYKERYGVDEHLYKQKLSENQKLLLEEASVLTYQAYSDLGEEVFRATCLYYPEYLKSEKADFPSYYSRHIAVFESDWNRKYVELSDLGTPALQATILLLSFVVGYLFNRSSLKVWRIVVGFITGSIFGWVAGTLIVGFAASIFWPSSIANIVLTAFVKSPLFALFGAGAGVYFGRAKLKRSGE